MRLEKGIPKDMTRKIFMNSVCILSDSKREKTYF
jgi:hypothetical protein